MANFFFDPITYQLYFSCVSENRHEKALGIALHETLKEMMPYFVSFIKLSPDNTFTLNFCGQREGKSITYNRCLRFDLPDIFNTFYDHPQHAFETVSNLCLNTDLDYAYLTTHHHKISQNLMEQLDGKQAREMRAKTVLKSRKSDKECIPGNILAALSCPTDDLRNILCPANIAWREFMSFFCTTYEQKCPGQYQHILFVQLPRVLLDYHNEQFPFQEIWCERIRKLCGIFTHSVGAVKMDAMLSHYRPGIINRHTSHNHDSTPPSLTAKLPGYAWAVCYTKDQIAALGGINTVQSWNCFHHIEVMPNGNVFLQLTDDVNVVKRETLMKAGCLLRPNLRMGMSFRMDNLPISFRLALEESDISAEEFGFYQLNMPY